MKRLTLLATIIFALLLSSINSKAQSYVLYGTTENGGINGSGIIHQYNISSGTDSILYNFSDSTGSSPLGSIVIDTNNGLYYGAASAGGKYGYGVIYNFNPTTGQYIDLYDLKGSDGASPHLNDLSFYNGLFYGMTYLGGTSNEGVIFSFNPANNQYLDLVNFTNSTGSPTLPFGQGLCLYKNMFYGVTQHGGTNRRGANDGTIFKFNPATGKDSILFTFTGANGFQPESGILALDTKNGLFYGTTAFGGSKNQGVIYSFNVLTGQEKVVYNFYQATGFQPDAGLLYDSVADIFYGNTSSGGAYSAGVIYSFNPNTNNYNVLADFNDTNGSTPLSDLTLGPCGVLYGTAIYGGEPTHNGTVYSCDPVSRQLNVLFVFQYTDGSLPYGNLTLVQISGPPHAPLPRGPKASFVCSPNIICGGSPATLTASGLNSYLWNTGATTSSITISPTAPTAYSVIGSGSNGCLSNSIDTVKVNPILTITASNNKICIGNSTTLTVSGADSSNNQGTYLWSNGSTNSSITVSPTTTTTYSVSGTTIGGCTGSTLDTIIVNPLPVITITASQNPVCATGGVTLTASGASTYLWNTGDITSSIFVVPNGTTVYSVIGTNALGCSNNAIDTIVVNPFPILTISSSGNLICAGNSVTLTASGGSNYSWSDGETTSSIIVSPLNTTIYYLIGSSPFGCVGITFDTIVVNTTATLNISPSASTINAGGSTTLTASGGVSGYTWAPSTGLSATSGASVIANPTSTTTYTVSSTNSSGCISTQTVIVTVNTGPIFINPPITTICSGNSVTLTASGGKNYIWNTGHAGATLTISPTVTTTYTVTGKVGVSPYSQTVVVNVNPTPTVNISPTSATICNGSSTTLTAGGADSYSWSPATGLNSTTTNIVTANPISNTNYTVTGTTNAGCSATQTVKVTVNALPKVKTNDRDSVCSGNFIAINASGALTYVWSNGATTNTIEVSPTSNTIYTVIGTNANGCNGTAGDTITVNPTPIVTITSSSPTICKGISNAVLTASGANTYKWSTGSTNDTIIVSPNATHTYNLTGSGIGGCKASSSYSVIVNNCLPGSTCITPINIPAEGSACINNQELQGNTKWYSFTASGKYLNLLVSSFNTDSSSGTISKAYLYSSCNGMPMDSASPSNTDSSTVTITDTNIIIGNTYLIKLSHTLNSCTNCNSNTVVFNVCPTVLTVYTHQPTAVSGVLEPALVLLNVCGLNYVEAHQLVETKSQTSPIPFNTNGTGLPTSVTLKGLPTIAPCHGAILKAYLYFMSSYYFSSLPFGNINPFPTVTVSNSGGVKTTFPVNYLGLFNIPECWGDEGTFAGSADVTSIINGNGIYNISFSPGAGLSGNDMYGVSLIVVYQDLTASYQGNIEIDDGNIIQNYFSAVYYTMTDCFSKSNVCLPGTPGTAKAFSIMSGANSNYAGNVHVDTYNNTTVSFPNLFWNFDVTPITLTSGQTSVPYAFYTNNTSQTAGGDCYGVGLTGLYWQSSCAPPCPVIAINASPSPNICIGSSVTLTASGGNNYVWNTGATTSSITVSPTSSLTYFVTSTTSTGCTQKVSIVVNVGAINIAGPSATCAGNLVNVGGKDYAALNLTSTISGFACTNPTYTWSLSANAIANGAYVQAALSGSNATVYVPYLVSILTKPFTVTLDVCCGSNCCTQTFLVGGCCDQFEADGFTDFNANTLTSSTPLGSGTIVKSGNNYTIQGDLNMNINGYFIVNSGITLTLNECDVLMGSFSNILVQNGANLIINNSHIHSCDEMWQGIDVQPSGTINVDNSLIEDAIDAITSENGALYTITASDFNKDYVGLNIMPYNGTHSGNIAQTYFRCYDDTYTFGSSPGFILGTTPQTLVSPSPYLGHRGLIGINIASVKSLTIGFANNLTSTNTFDNLDCGILISNSSAAIANNIFQNITTNTTQNPTAQLSGIAVINNTVKNTVTVGQSATTNNNTFINCNRGVNINNNTKLTASAVYNSFNDCQYAVLVGNTFGQNNTASKFSITNNTISNSNAFLTANSPNGIGLFGNQATSNISVLSNNLNNCMLGIVGFNNATSKIIANTNTLAITGTIPATGANYGIGIFENALSTTTRYTAISNTISTYNNGIYTVNLQGAVIDTNIINLNSPGTTNIGIEMADAFSCTVIDNDITGLGNADIGIDLNTCLANNFLGCNIANSTYYGLSFEGPQSLNTFVTQNLMINNNTGLILNANAIIGQQGDATAPLDNTWDGTYSFATYANNSFGSQSPFYVQNKPFYNPPLNKLSFNKAPYNITPMNNANSGAHSCYYCKSNKFKNCPPPVAQLTLAHAIVNNTDTFNLYPEVAHWVEKHALYKFIKDTGSSLLSDSLINSFYDSLQNSNIGKIDSIDNLLADTNGPSSAELNSALAINTSIVPINAPEGTYKAVGNIIISMLLNGQLVPDSIEAATLRTVAQECPEKYGKEVFTARAIMDIMDNTLYHNTCSNRSDNAIKPATKSALSNAKVYPNPANSLLNVEILLQTDEVATICLYNSMGQVVKCENLNSSITVLPIGDFAVGIYYYRITDKNNDLIKADKIMIVH